MINWYKVLIYLVKFVAKGAKEEVTFPVLAVFASNIDDVEIVASVPSETKAAKKSTAGNSGAKVANRPNTTTNNTTFEPTYQSPHATPSVYAKKIDTFPTGNARQTLPPTEFDFAANLARFDKANEFKKIQADDSIPKADRLVSINSPQRKLGIRESVLDPKESVNNSASTVSNNANTSTINANVARSTSPKGVTDEIMEKFKHLTLPKSKSSPLLVEDGTTSEDEQCDHNTNTTINISSPVTPMIPMISGEKYEKYCAANPSQVDIFRSTGALNFAHHLLADLDASKSIVLLLGVGESSAILMETFVHLCNHSRLKQDVYAIFAAGAAGSAGKRIELSSAVKLGRKKLMTMERVKFTTSLSDILKLSATTVTVFDALGHDGELTENAAKGLTEWMKKVKTVYGIESSLLKNSKDLNNPVKLVTFGIARDTITPSLQTSKSILYVDTSVSGKLLKEEFGLSADIGEELYSESFVTEVEY